MPAADGVLISSGMPAPSCSRRRRVSGPCSHRCANGRSLRDSGSRVRDCPTYPYCICWRQLGGTLSSQSLRFSCSASATHHRWFHEQPLRRKRSSASEGRREPEGRNRSDREHAGYWMDDLVMAFQTVSTSSLRLRDARPLYRDLFEQVRGRDGRGRIGGEFRHELWMCERSPEVGGRFPDGIVEVSRALADRAVKRGRNEARLPLHEQRIVPPSLEETSARPPCRA